MFILQYLLGGIEQNYLKYLKKDGDVGLCSMTLPGSLQQPRDPCIRNTFAKQWSTYIFANSFELSSSKNFWVTLCLHCIYPVKLVYILKNSTEKTVFDFLKKIVFVFSVPTSKDIEMEVFKKVKRTSKVACTVFYYSSLQYTKVKNNGKVFSPLVV